MALPLEIDSQTMLLIMLECRNKQLVKIWHNLDGQLIIWLVTKASTVMPIHSDPLVL